MPAPTERPNASIYGRLGVRTIINASGPSTRLSGGIMDPEVAQAMAEASQWCVDIAELQARACELIAEATGAEAGYVTAGAAAALMLGTAACLCGLDPARMNRLPDTTGMPNEVIVARSQRNMYDRAVTQAGARLIEVGIPDRVSGAGVRDAQVWEFEAAISEKTAAILFVAQEYAEPSLPQIVEMARRRRVPVIVDAAAQLPPAANLKRFIAEGADLVAISGGKALGGPQASGILAGRHDLIQSAALQQLDHDTYFEQWSPPSVLFDKSKLIGLPASGIGRTAKCGKEEIVGLLTALRRFQEQDCDQMYEGWLDKCRALLAGLQGIAGTDSSIFERNVKGLPEVHLRVDQMRLGVSAAEIIKRLQDGDPSVHVNHARARDGVIVLGPTCLKAADIEMLVHRVRAELSAGRRQL